MASKASVAVWLGTVANVERGLLHLLSLQTSDEQASRTTSHLNEKGFSMRTVKSGTYMAQYVKGSSRPAGQRLTGQWIAKGKEVCLHHWRQMGSLMAPQVQDKPSTFGATVYPGRVEHVNCEGSNDYPACFVMADAIKQMDPFNNPMYRLTH